MLATHTIIIMIHLLLSIIYLFVCTTPLVFWCFCVLFIYLFVSCWICLFFSSRLCHSFIKNHIDFSVSYIQGLPSPRMDCYKSPK